MSDHAVCWELDEIPMTGASGPIAATEAFSRGGLTSGGTRKGVFIIPAAAGTGAAVPRGEILAAVFGPGEAGGFDSVDSLQPLRTSGSRNAGETSFKQRLLVIMGAEKKTGRFAACVLGCVVFGVVSWREPVVGRGHLPGFRRFRRTGHWRRDVRRF